ncbi:MAG: T9SS type A sorting domain-containing protein [Bacteroidota bacterium]
MQDWEGQSGSGNWLRIENETWPHNFTRGSDTDAVYAGNKASYISTDDVDYGYDETEAAEVFAYKDIEFPASGDFYIKFNWKCVGDVEAGIVYDYLRVFIVPPSTDLDETDLENEANGFEILGPGTDNRFVEQATFTLLNYKLTEEENSLLRDNEYRLVFMWKNDGQIYGDPAAFDNVIISDGNATQPLAGTYEIGKNSTGTQRFDSIMHATALLNMNGVSGNVNFELTDEDYSVRSGDLPLRIEDFNSNPNSTVSNAELLLQAVQDESITPTISGSRDGNSGIIFIDRASNITINGDNGGSITKDLSIENNSTTNPIGIYIGSDIGSAIANENIEIKNTNINIGSTTGDGIVISSYNDYSAGLYSNITISNNKFTGGRWGIYANGNDGNANGSDLSIQNNSMDDATNPIELRGVEVNGTENVTIINNRIGNINSNLGGNVRGVRIGANSSNVTIEKNEIYNLLHSDNYGVHGISIASSIINSNVLVKNNMIYNISADGSDYNTSFLNNAIGIAVEGNQSGISILNNSIYLKEGGSNILTANEDSYTACLSIGTGATINTLKNNILINTLGGDNSGAQPAGYTTIAYQGTFTDHFPDIDYNLYYSQVSSLAGGTESLASDFSDSASSLADLKTVSENDLSSIGASSLDMGTFNGSGFTFDPERLFTAVSEGTGDYLEIDDSQQEAWLINAAGTHLVDMTEDFNGASRNTNITAIPPSLGSFEFTPNTQTVPAYQDGAIADAATSDFYVGNRKILSLTWNENGGSLPSAIEVNYFPGTLPPDTDGHPVFNGYVQVNATGGSGYEYNLELAYEPALLAGIATDDILLTKRSDDVNDWSTWPTTVNTVNRVFSVSNIDNGFSYFTGTDQNDPLPVELISFSAKVLKGKIDIQWETASEKNNDHFIVEKKGLDNDWKNISTVQGAGNSNNLIRYSITDLNPVSGTQYYRLKQVDTDGKFEYSHVLRVEYGGNRQLVFPNPFKEKIFVKSKGENSVKRIELKNITGNSINITSEYLGQNKWQVNTQSLETGTYILYVYMENQVEVRKIIKR